MVQRISNVEMSCPINHKRGWKIQEGLISRPAVSAETCSRRRTSHNITNGPAQVGLLGKGMSMTFAIFGKRIIILSLSHQSERAWLRS
jgi:hypothetical protein